MHPKIKFTRKYTRKKHNNISIKWKNTTTFKRTRFQVKGAQFTRIIINRHSKKHKKLIKNIINNKFICYFIYAFINNINLSILIGRKCRLRYVRCSFFNWNWHRTTHRLLLEPNINRALFHFIWRIIRW